MTVTPSARHVGRFHALLGPFLVAATLAAFPAVAAQEAPRLRLPIECVPGKSCWIANHVDRDPGPGSQDYRCGRLTYDGHNGTDFAIRDLRAMADGVRVLAAAPGRVAAIRDGEPDRNVREHGVDTVKDRECGNGVRIDHGDGWQTQYCHLKRGSIQVKPGSKVSAGEPLALVGLSGLSELPHLHFVVRHSGRIVDPFHGVPDSGGCGTEQLPLWDDATRAALVYAPGSLYNFGVAARALRAESARSGEHRDRVVAAEAPVFAVWVEVFGVDAGDVLEIRVEGPGGNALVNRRMPLERQQARIYRMIARKRGAAPWPSGEYHVRISLSRAGGPPHGASNASFIAQVR